MEELYSSRKGKRCIIYIRVSSERQVQGYSLEGQKRFLKEWAEFEGMTVIDIYVEPGKSGKSISGRDVFQRMLDDISTGNISVDYVVVFKLSRFGRNAKDILNSLTFIQRFGVNLICKEDGLDSSTSMGKMMITILGAVAEMERENILIQTMLGREEKAKQGGWNGGFAPYGYELVNGHLEIKEDEAAIVRLIFHKFLVENMGYSTIAGYLNKQGIPKSASKNSHGRKFTDWSIHMIKRMLSNPLYTGRVVFGRTRLERVEGTESDYRRRKSKEYIQSEELAHEPIITEEIYEQAQVKLQEKATTGHPGLGRPAKHLLSGILKCPMCGSNMYSDASVWTNSDGTRRYKMKYQCGHYARSKYGQCKKNVIDADWVESEVIAYTKLLVQNEQFAEDIQKQIGEKVDVSEIGTEIVNYNKRLKQLERSKANLERDIDDITDDDKNSERKRKDMNRRLNSIYDEIAEVEVSIADCEQMKESAEHDVLTAEAVYQMLLGFDKFFDKMDASDRRKLIETLISEVHLYPKETWEKGKSPVKEIKYAFPVSDEVLGKITEKVATVESCVLLERVSNRKADSYVKLNVKMEDYYRIKDNKQSKK